MSRNTIKSSGDQSQYRHMMSGVDNTDPSFVYIDPHVLATPVLVDLDGNGVTSEMILPVSYYFDPYHYR